MGDQTLATETTDADRLNEDFVPHDWENLKELIGSNNLGLLRRKPQDLERYLAWSAETKARYGSVTDFILQNRLPAHWGQPPFEPESPVPFDRDSDFHVLVNDWPYGLVPGIAHIVVWSRTPIPVDAGKGDVTPESRALVAAFVRRHFVDPLGPGGADRVLWFKNWTSLQSVRSLEHIHVLVRDVDDETMQRWTGHRPQQQ
ncbi:Uncharacterized protein ESCO_001271 [Escovopsis weberi]|uniref:N-acetylglucosamine-induced protein 1 n=1 Tax=Escovopsis weberi TaxID=150374 RepID=A0A0M8N2Y1_ESCWE|nr:Uncharacterized protein ESCO_001271 [Escovopsis weberi]